MADDLTNAEVDQLSKVMGQEVTGPTNEVSRAQFMQLETADIPTLPPTTIERFFDVKVEVEVILGRRKATLGQVLGLQKGKVIELDKMAGEPVEIIANGRLLARAEVVVIEDHFGVKILEIVGSQQKLEVANAAATAAAEKA